MEISLIEKRVIHSGLILPEFGIKIREMLFITTIVVGKDKRIKKATHQP